MPATEGQVPAGGPEQGVCHSPPVCPRRGLCSKESAQDGPREQSPWTEPPACPPCGSPRKETGTLNSALSAASGFRSRASAYLTILFSEKYVKPGVIYGPQALSWPLRLWDIFIASQWDISITSQSPRSLQPHRDPADPPAHAAGLFFPRQGVCRPQSPCQAWRGRGVAKGRGGASVGGHTGVPLSTPAPSRDRQRVSSQWGDR